MKKALEGIKVFGPFHKLCKGQYATPNFGRCKVLMWLKWSELRTKVYLIAIWTFFTSGIAGDGVHLFYGMEQKIKKISCCWYEIGTGKRILIYKTGGAGRMFGCLRKTFVGRGGWKDLEVWLWWIWKQINPSINLLLQAKRVGRYRPYLKKVRDRIYWRKSIKVGPFMTKWKGKMTAR